MSQYYVTQYVVVNTQASVMRYTTTNAASLAVIPESLYALMNSNSYHTITGNEKREEAQRNVFIISADL